MKKLLNKFSSLKRSTKETSLTIGTVILVYVIVQILKAAGLMSSLMAGILVPVCAYALVALGLNLCVGYLGELSLGHAGFMCLGAYTGAFISKVLRAQISNNVLLFIIALIGGVIVAGLFGFLIGIPVLRLRGDYLAIVTLAFGEIIKNVVNILYVVQDKNGLHANIGDSTKLVIDEDTKAWVVNGPQGFSRMAQLSTFTIGVVLIVLSLLIIYNFVNSRSGRAVMAIRDNRIAAESVGINITGYKLLAFSLSAAIAGAGGVLYAHNITSFTATTNNFGYNMSITILVFVVLGGIGNLPGSIIAATVLTILPEALRGFSTYRMLIYSIVLIVVMICTWSPKAKAFLEKYSIKKLIANKKGGKANGK